MILLICSATETGNELGKDYLRLTQTEFTVM